MGGALKKFNGRGWRSPGFRRAHTTEEGKPLAYARSTGRGEGKRKPGALARRRAAVGGFVGSPSARQEEITGERPGRRFGMSRIVLFLTRQLRAGPRSQFLFHIIKKIMKVHGKATKPFRGFLTLATSSPGRDRGAAGQGSFRPLGGFRPSGGLGDHERPVVCPTLRTWFHSTYIKHKPELTNGFLPGSAAPHGRAAVAPRWREVHSQIRCEVTKTNRNKQTT